jgi:DNA topoisomerase-2
VPTILINGSNGIGTGFSSYIPCYNSLQIVDYVKQKLTKNNIQNIEFLPYYHGFNGTIEKIENNKYLMRGIYKRINDTQIEITELPIDIEVDEYTKKILEKFENSVETTLKGKNVVKQSLLKNSQANCTEHSIYILLTFNSKEQLDNLLNKKDNYVNEFEKMFKLTLSISTNNMYLYDGDLKMRKFETVEMIIDNFIEYRMQGYVERKKYLLDELLQKKIKLENQKRFIEEIINNKIDVRNKTKKHVIEILCDNNFAKINDDYDYLIELPIQSLTTEKVEKLIKDYNEAKEQYDILFAKNETELWLEDLNKFIVAYNEFLVERENKKNEEMGNDGDEKKEVKKIAKKIISKKK